MSPPPEPPLFRVEFNESISAYEPAPVHLEVVAPKTAPPRRALTMDEYNALLSGPEIDTSVPFKFSVTSFALPGRELRDYLRFSEVERPSRLVVQFWVEPSQTLLDSKQDHFDSVVQKEFHVTIKVKLKGTAGTLSGKFGVKIESRVKIHWEWTGHPLGFPDRLGRDSPIPLQPDGFSWFELKVWATRWDARSGRKLPTDPEAYEFSHWIGPGNRGVNYDVFKPQPEPHDPVLRGDKQDANKWYSKADLPDRPRFPGLYPLPFETEMRVRAWNRGAIKRIPNDVIVKDGEVEVGEVLIPVRLVKLYILTISVFLDEDRSRSPLRTYQRTVNGERVTVYCPNLPPDVTTTIRWRLSGPAQYIVPPGSGLGVPQPFPFLGLASKRRYQTEDRDTPLVPVLLPSGMTCRGTARPLEIVDDPGNDANPPVYLDVELDKIRVNWVSCSTGSAIVIDGSGSRVDLTFGATYGGRVPARNTPLTWRLFTNPEKTQGRLQPTQGTTDGRGHIRAIYTHDFTPIIRRRREIEIRLNVPARLTERREYLRRLQEADPVERRNLEQAEFLRGLLATQDFDDQAIEHLYRQRYNEPPPQFRVPGSGQFSGSRWAENVTTDDLEDLQNQLRSRGPRAESEGTGYDPTRVQRIQDNSAAITEFTRSLERLARDIDNTRRDIQRIQREVDEAVGPMFPTSERVDFFHKGQLVGRIPLPIVIRRADGG